VHSRFADVWSDAVAAEAAVWAEQEVEHRYRQALARTDDVLGKLERRNLRGQRELDEGMRRDLARTLGALPPDAKGRFPEARTVQEALDGIFAVQENLMHVLQRILHWDRLLTARSDAEVERANELAARRSA
jgi:hypothetical protein